ncbi:MAG: SIMPL domain-containing protein [Patescibacteria group bacterium]
MEKRGFPAGFLVLGVCLVLSAVAFGIFFYQSRLPAKTIRVVGAATRRFDSDVVKWRLTMVRNTGADDLKRGYAAIKDDLKSFAALLAAAGIPAREMTVQPINVEQVYSQYEKSGNPVGYRVVQSLYVVSRDLGKVEKLALNPGTLVDSGILLQSSNLEYYCSELSEIKRQLLAAATKDARRRAEEIARGSGDRVGSIESARVGVFQITEPYSTEVSDYGIYNTATREKDITVTISVVFGLR